MKSGGWLTSAVLQTAAVMRSYGQHNCRMSLGSNTDIEKVIWINRIILSTPKILNTVTMTVVWRQCPILWFVMCGQRVSSQQSLDQAGRGYVTSVTTAEE